MQDKLGKQNFHEEMKKVFEPVTKTFKDVSDDSKKAMMITSKEHNKALEILNNKLLEYMNDRGIIDSYLLSPPSKITNPENTTQFKLAKYYTSNKVIDLLIQNSIPITLHDNLLTFRDTNKQFELNGDLLEMITNKHYYVNLAKLSDKKLMYDLQKK